MNTSSSRSVIRSNRRSRGRQADDTVRAFLDSVGLLDRVMARETELVEAARIPEAVALQQEKQRLMALCQSQIAALRARRADEPTVPVEIKEHAEQAVRRLSDTASANRRALHYGRKAQESFINTLTAQLRTRQAERAGYTSIGARAVRTAMDRPVSVTVNQQT